MPILYITRLYCFQARPPSQRRKATNSRRRKSLQKAGASGDESGAEELESTIVRGMLYLRSKKNPTQQEAHGSPLSVLARARSSSHSPQLLPQFDPDSCIAGHSPTLSPTKAATRRSRSRSSDPGFSVVRHSPTLSPTLSPTKAVSRRSRSQSTDLDNLMARHSPTLSPNNAVTPPSMTRRPRNNTQLEIVSQLSEEEWLTPVMADGTGHAPPRMVGRQLSLLACLAAEAPQPPPFPSQLPSPQPREITEVPPPPGQLPSPKAGALRSLPRSRSSSRDISPLPPPICTRTASGSPLAQSPISACGVCARVSPSSPLALCPPICACVAPVASSSKLATHHSILAQESSGPAAGLPKQRVSRIIDMAEESQHLPTVEAVQHL